MIYINRQKRKLEVNIKAAKKSIIEGKVSLCFALLVVSNGLKIKKKCNFMKFNTFITQNLNINFEGAGIFPLKFNIFERYNLCL